MRNQKKRVTEEASSPSSQPIYWGSVGVPSFPIAEGVAVCRVVGIFFSKTYELERREVLFEQWRCQRSAMQYASSGIVVESHGGREGSPRSALTRGDGVQLRLRACCSNVG